MSAHHVGIVWNPSKTEKEDLEAALPDNPDLTITWHETEEDDPGKSATQAALDAGAEVVIAAGGDGTVRAVAGHLAETGSDAELGIVPLGTGNLLARNLDVPLNNLGEAMERALNGTARDIDMGWVEVTLADGTNREPFVVMAGFGIDAHMITETNDDLKDKAGWLAYVESLGRAVSASDVMEINLSREGERIGHEAAHTLIVGNCGTLQGGITLLPDADPSDGELDVLILKAEGVTGWLDTMKNMVWDNGLRRMMSKDDSAQSSESAIHQRVSSLTIELEQPRVVEVDGDEVGETEKIDVTIEPAALRVR
ncbi:MULTISPECIES: diacylglycerol kinase family protein [unclassified Brevibacterium]|uniref:diacylglycerol/lipid kinase family protein n=1 Tax=unclassified Brevibacterium TaxID=2614124 RepID=UPI0010F53768|nr:MULTISPECIES: diacylglycerol kinase family protein [unclassified Brevibacterium]MCM1011262.1 NAD(+)/NADH kinase [Brevibacterium sp. XM4083]